MRTIAWEFERSRANDRKTGTWDLARDAVCDDAWLAVLFYAWNTAPERVLFRVLKWLGDYADGWEAP